MALKPGLSLRQSQRLALTPTIRAGLSILRLSAADLEEALARASGSNPFLLHPRPGPSAGEIALETLAARPSLTETLQSQIAAMTLPEDVRASAAYLAGMVTDEGFLPESLPELADETGVSLTLLEAGLDALQACEPAGIGARDLAECLALQLIDSGLSQDDAMQTVAHLDLFAARDWSTLGKRLRLSGAGLQKRAALLRSLRPRPVEPDSPAPQALRPDLVVERSNDGALAVRLPETGYIRIDPELAKESGTTGFAADALQEARALLRALRFRGLTLLRIGRFLLQHQHAFFDRGAAHLRPLSRAELANALGLHASTVGRAVSGKALLFDGRLWPLESFFSAALGLAGGGVVSAYSVQRRIVALIGAESPDAPLSDAVITTRLHAEGVDIARRTVAKYRGRMRIPASAARLRRHREIGGNGLSPAAQGTRA